jgi:hypothetical protein
MRKHYKLRFQAFNVSRRNEPVATDTVFLDTPAIDNGAIIAQIFVGRDTLVTDIYSMKSNKEFISTLEDNICKCGAEAQGEISNKVHKLLQALFIDDWQSEPYHQQQNYAEQRYCTIKGQTNLLMNRTGAPTNTWFLCVEYGCFVFNRLANKHLNWKTPVQLLTDETSDISVMMFFTCYEEAYFSIDDPKLDTSEE